MEVKGCSVNVSFRVEVLKRTPEDVWEEYGGQLPGEWAHWEAHTQAASLILEQMAEQYALRLALSEHLLFHEILEAESEARAQMEAEEIDDLGAIIVEAAERLLNADEPLDEEVRALLEEMVSDGAPDDTIEACVEGSVFVREVRVDIV